MFRCLNVKIFECLDAWSLEKAIHILYAQNLSQSDRILFSYLQYVRLPALVDWEWMRVHRLPHPPRPTTTCKCEHSSSISRWARWIWCLVALPERSTLNNFAFSNYLLHSSHAAKANFRMTFSRTALFAPESETKTEIARCRPFGSVTSPTSLVATVTPFTVGEVPVLCATTVPSGSSPLMRFEPVVVSALRTRS